MENSNIYVTISLDPFYQQFLRGYYECDEIVFSFPRASRKNWLPISFKAALWYPPNKLVKNDYGEKTFRINIPNWDDKDPHSMNYISKQANKEFVNKIKDFYVTVWYSFIGEMLEAGYGPKAIVNLFMDRYAISPQFTERVEKDCSRYTQYFRDKRWRKSRKKISVSSQQNSH